MLQRSFQMAEKKRKSNVLETEVMKDDKHAKIDSKTTNDLLRLNDENFEEKDYQNAFQTIANQLLNHYELVVNKDNLFRLCEIEFYFYHSTRHPDTFAHRHPEQIHPANWYFHRQGTSTTASYKAGTYK